MMLLMSILYLFAIAFTQAATGHFIEPSERHDLQHLRALENWYGDVPRSVFTLFLSISNGVGWVEVVEPLGKVGSIWAILFVVFISFTYFAVLNVVTGVFCQT